MPYFLLQINDPLRDLSFSYPQYTLQSHYLLRNTVDLSIPYLVLITIIGFSGYYIFRTVNNQKDLVRKMDGKCNIWGKPAKVIRTEYTTSDGKVHRSLLLASGFWGTCFS